MKARWGTGMIRQPVSQSILLVFHRNLLTDRLLLREREIGVQPRFFSSPEKLLTRSLAYRKWPGDPWCSPLAYIKMSYFGYKCCNRPGEQQKHTTINNLQAEITVQRTKNQPTNTQDCPLPSLPPQILAGRDRGENERSWYWWPAGSDGGELRKR